MGKKNKPNIGRNTRHAKYARQYRAKKLLQKYVAEQAMYAHIYPQQLKVEINPFQYSFEENEEVSELRQPKLEIDVADFSVTGSTLGDTGTLELRQPKLEYDVAEYYVPEFPLRDTETPELRHPKLQRDKPEDFTASTVFASNTPIMGDLNMSEQGQTTFVKNAVTKPIDAYAATREQSNPKLDKEKAGKTNEIITEPIETFQSQQLKLEIKKAKEAYAISIAEKNRRKTLKPKKVVNKSAEEFVDQMQYNLQG